VKETDVQMAICDYLATIGDDCLFWRNNNVGVFDPTRRCFRKNHSKYTPNGISDILGIYRGKPMAIEVKRPKPDKTYPTKEQKVFLQVFAEAGGIAFVARSVEDVIKGLNS